MGPWVGWMLLVLPLPTKTMSTLQLINVLGVLLLHHPLLLLQLRLPLHLLLHLLLRLLLLQPLLLLLLVAYAHPALDCKAEIVTHVITASGVRVRVNLCRLRREWRGDMAWCCFWAVCHLCLCLLLWASGTEGIGLFSIRFYVILTLGFVKEEIYMSLQQLSVECLTKVAITRYKI